MSGKDDDFYIVTEVGTFGDLNIADPTKKKAAKKDEDVEALIREAVKENSTNLSGR